MLLPPRTPLHKLFFTSNILMNFKYFVKPTPFPLLPSPLSSLPPLFYTPRFPLSPMYSKPISTTPHFSLKTSRFSSIPHSTIGTLVSEVGVENPENKRVESVQMKVLVQKLKEIEFDMAFYKPGQYSRLLCPKAFADAKSSYERMNKIPKVKQLRKVTEEDLELEPLCSEAVDYGVHRLWEHNNVGKMDYTSLPHFCRTEGSGSSGNSSGNCFSLDHPHHQQLYNYIKQQSESVRPIKQGSVHVDFPEVVVEEAEIV